MAGFEPATSSLPRKCSTPELHWQMFSVTGRKVSLHSLNFGSCFHKIRAEDEAQTRDPQLGRLMLYQLSYFRKCQMHKRETQAEEPHRA